MTRPPCVVPSGETRTSVRTLGEGFDWFEDHVAGERHPTFGVCQPQGEESGGVVRAIVSTTRDRVGDPCRHSVRPCPRTRHGEAVGGGDEVLASPGALPWHDPVGESGPRHRSQFLRAEPMGRRMDPLPTNPQRRQGLRPKGHRRVPSRVGPSREEGREEGGGEAGGGRERGRGGGGGPRGWGEGEPRGNREAVPETDRE